MDFDIGTLIYFVAIAIFIYRSFTKKKKAGPSQPKRAATEQQQNERRPSFEELLKEFTGMGGEAEEAFEEPTHQQSAEIVEDVKPVSTPERKSIKERALEKDRERKRGYEPSSIQVDEEEEEESDYREMFDDYDGARKAFVASQVFQRKF